MYEKSIELLNKSIGEELNAIHQYMYFHFHCDDQGYELLASLFKRIAIQEMQHAEMLAERILFLKGEVDMIPSAGVEKITDIKAMLDWANNGEQAAIRDYNLRANECAANADSQSKKLFEDLVMQEEGHYDQYDTELENMHKFGDNYLALQSIERSKNIAASSKTSME